MYDSNVRICRDGIRRNAFRSLSDPEIQERFWAQVTKTDTCWLWNGATSGLHPYGHMTVHKKQTKAHRFSYELHKGKIPPGLIVRHKCDVPLCVNPDHLEVGTQKDNIRDKMERGRHRFGTLKGEANKRSKYKLAQVVQAVELLNQGETCQRVSALTGISLTSVGAIKQGRIWRHVSHFDGPGGETICSPSG